MEILQQPFQKNVVMILGIVLPVANFVEQGKDLRRKSEKEQPVNKVKWQTVPVPKSRGW